MMQYVLVGIGGILGSLARYQLGVFISKNLNSRFPLGTFLINITGAMLLGIVTSLAVDKNLYLFIADGFLGAYTTFSTFTFEGINLYRENAKVKACVYILGSLILGLIGFAFGAAICKAFMV